MTKLLHKIIPVFIFCMIFMLLLFPQACRNKKPEFRVISFFSAENDPAHISFVNEANRWFPEMAEKYNFIYYSTSDWDNLNPEFLSGYQVIVFLNSRPDSTDQRTAFRQYMENGGAWMGFHFAGFALTPSAFPQNWDWYHNIFLGSGEYKGNTWRPTSAVLHTDDLLHPATKHLPETFTA
ncbi:MAG: ThuA domain-containing protein [Bacteroidales bacterium]|nr:ThuA domain-containing protein [Bacteroidales bacterium]